MPFCPECSSPGAYIGAMSVECRNPKCRHFKLEPEAACPCCGGKAHEPLREYQKDAAQKYVGSNPCAEIALSDHVSKLSIADLVKAQTGLPVYSVNMNGFKQLVVDLRKTAKMPAIVLIEDIEKASDDEVLGMLDEMQDDEEG